MKGWLIVGIVLLLACTFLVYCCLAVASEQSRQEELAKAARRAPGEKP